MKKLGIGSVSATAKKEYKKWEKGQNGNFLQQQFQTERPHSTLQYNTPEQTEQDYWIKENKSSRIWEFRVRIWTIFILGVPFLQERETLKRWLEFSVFSIEKEAEIWMSHFWVPNFDLCSIFAFEYPIFTRGNNPDRATWILGFRLKYLYTYIWNGELCLVYGGVGALGSMGR